LMAPRRLNLKELKRSFDFLVGMAEEIGLALLILAAGLLLCYLIGWGV